MQPIRRKQLIRATLEAVDQVGMSDASIAMIARLAGVSNGIIAHYFQDKNGLLEATMRHLMKALNQAVRTRRESLIDDSPRSRLKAIIEGNFDDSQLDGSAMKTWLAFWAFSMHQPSLQRLQRVNDHRLYSNLCCEFRRVMPKAQARSAARGMAALIDGLWLRGALTKGNFDIDQALQLAYDYMDQVLAMHDHWSPPLMRIARGSSCPVSNNNDCTSMAAT